MGLTSFFKSAGEKLLPRFNKTTDIIEFNIPMSKYQISIYEQARNVERKQEARNAQKMKKGLYEESTSTYRVYSRACCNFVFPEQVIRPTAKKNENVYVWYEKLMKLDPERWPNINAFDNLSIEELKAIYQENPKNKNFAEEVEKEVEKEMEKEVEKEVEKEESKNESKKQDETKDDEPSLDGFVLNGNKTNELALEKLSNITIDNKEDPNFGQKILFGDNLRAYSPKFHKILEIIQNEENIGLHLIYSSFKTLEGVGILKLVLEANGFVQFKLTQKKTGNSSVKEYEINEQELKEKPAFALYTGDETVEEKEITRLIFNSQWDKLKDVNLKRQLKNVFNNNFFGDVIKCLMITSSGAEGITLKNTRFVHLVEPYWHPVRKEQVIGRAVRICSHEDLDEELKNVKVFKYLMTFTDEQLRGDPESKDPKKRVPSVSKELLLKDLSKYAGKKNARPVTTDEALNEISNIKETINKDILDTIQFSAIDCKIHNKPNSKEYKQCFTFNSPSIERYLFKPNYKNDESDKTLQINETKITWNPETISFKGKKYIFKRLKTDKPYGTLFDYELYISGNQNPNALVRYGELKRGEGDKKNKLVLVR